MEGDKACVPSDFKERNTKKAQKERATEIYYFLHSINVRAMFDSFNNLMIITLSFLGMR